MMIDYEEFDSKLLARIAMSPVRFVSLCTHMHSESRAIAKRMASDPSDAFRVTDRRLQSLRKRGLISYSTKNGWSLKAKKEDQCNASSVGDR